MKAQLWLDCNGHNLNLVLAHDPILGDKQQSTEDEEHLNEVHQENLMTEVIQLIDVCTRMVAHVKRSGIPAKLDTTLKQAVSTRWNSILTKLKSVLKNADDLKKLADEFGDKKLQRCSHAKIVNRPQPSLHLVYPT